MLELVLELVLLGLGDRCCVGKTILTIYNKIYSSRTLLEVVNNDMPEKIGKEKKDGVSPKDSDSQV